LYAINPGGTQLWKFTAGTNEYIDTSPAIGSDGTIYIASNSYNNSTQINAGYLYAINPDGTQLWKFTAGTDEYIGSSPAIGSDGTIYIATSSYNYSTQTESGYLYAIN
jgi:sugar lactone lactonase YvrE